MCQAICYFTFIDFIFLLKCTEQLVPDDEDRCIILVDAVTIPTWRERKKTRQEKELMNHRVSERNEIQEVKKTKQGEEKKESEHLHSSENHQMVKHNDIQDDRSGHLFSNRYSAAAAQGETRVTWTTG